MWKRRGCGWWFALQAAQNPAPSEPSRDPPPQLPPPPQLYSTSSATFPLCLVLQQTLWTQEPTPFSLSRGTHSDPRGPLMHPLSYYIWEGSSHSCSALASGSLLVSLHLSLDLGTLGASPFSPWGHTLSSVSLTLFRGRSSPSGPCIPMVRSTLQSSVLEASLPVSVEGLGRWRRPSNTTSFPRAITLQVCLLTKPPLLLDPRLAP